MTEAAWVETYRGTVYRWELDHNDHLTVAYYFERFGDAAHALLEALRFEPTRFETRDVYVRYLHEFHAGDLLHMTSGVIDVAENGFVAGGKLFNTETGVVAATVEHRLACVGGARLTSAERRTLDARRTAWDGAPREQRLQPKTYEGFRDAARDTIKPSELDATGHVALAAYIHRFSAANGQSIAAFGITPGYMRDKRRGFSTFEFQLDLTGALAAGDSVRVKSALLHVGNSSMRIQHRMTNETRGAEVAILEQLGVHLDMDARRSTPLPDAIRAKALAVLVPTS